MIGLELLDAAARAVLIDDAGAVVRHAHVDVATDLQAAADAALSEVTSPPGAEALGIAALNLDAQPIAAVVAALASRYTAPVVASGVAAAAAEAWVGAARGVHNVVYFCVRDRTTAGIIRDGAAVFGAHGRAASVAWLALNPVEREDYRKMGCLEAEVAAAGIVRRLIWRMKAGDASRVADLVENDFTRITCEQVLTAARDGDGVATSVVRDTAKYLGMAAANLVLLLDPEMLVVGGLMADAGDLVLEPLRMEIGRRIPRMMMESLAIAPAALGRDAAAIGAARLAAPALR